MTRVLAIFVLLFLTVLPAHSQERSAKGFVENLLENMLSAEGRSLSIEDTSISLTGDVTVGRVEVRDGEVAWLVIEGLSVVWRPLSLFGKQLEVSSLTVDNVRMLRMPRTPEGNVAAPPELQDLSAAVIRQLEIRRLQIDEPVLGQAAELRLVGSGEITTEPVQILADATASRLDGKKGDLRLKFALDPRTRNVRVSLSFSEEADGILANLLDLRGEPSVDLLLDASGSYANWSSTFSVDFDKSRVFDGSANAVSDATEQMIRVEGAGTIGAFLPPSLEQAFTSESRLSALAHVPVSGGTALIDHVSLENEAFTFDLSGPADWQGDKSNLVARLAAKDAEAAFNLPVTASLGKASIKGLDAGLGVTGSLKAPDWRASLAFSGLMSDRMSLAGFRGSLQGRGLIATAEAPVSFNGSLGGTVGQGRNSELPPILIGPLSGTVAGNWNADSKLGIDSTKLMIGTSSIEAAGTLDPFGGSYDLIVKATAQSPATGTALLDRVMHGQVSARARIMGDGPDGFMVQDLGFSAPAISVVSSGRFDSKAADLSLEISLPDLGMVRNGLTGRAMFNANLKGPLTSLAASLEGTGENVTLLSKNLDAPKILARVSFNDGRPQGDISLSGSLEGRPIGLHGTFETAPGGTTILRDLNASSGSARATGELSWPPAGFPTGHVDFNAPDLRDVGPLMLIDLSGSMKGRIEMSASEKMHRTAISFDGSDVAGPGFSVGTAEGSLVIADLSGNPQPSGSATFRSLRIGSQVFDTAAITAEPNRTGGYRTTATVKSRDLSADAEADVSFAEGATRYSLSRLSGKLRGVSFKAAAPIVVQQAKEALNISSAALNVGKGVVTLDGQVMPNLDLKASIKALPLVAFETLGNIPGLRGTLAGDATISGTMSSPQGRYRLSVLGLTSTVLEDLRVGPFTATADGTVSGQTVTLTLKANAGPDISFTGSGNVSGSPSTIDMTVKGSAGNRLFTDRLARSGFRAEGSLTFDLRIAGPLGKPSINGEIALSKATLGDAGGQFTARNVTGRAELRGNTIRIVSLTGTTAGRGQHRPAG